MAMITTRHLFRKADHPYYHSRTFVVVSIVGEPDVEVVPQHNLADWMPFADPDCEQ